MHAPVIHALDLAGIRPTIDIGSLSPDGTIEPCETSSPYSWSDSSGSAPSSARRPRSPRICTGARWMRPVRTRASPPRPVPTTAGAASVTGRSRRSTCGSPTSTPHSCPLPPPCVSPLMPRASPLSPHPESGGRPHGPRRVRRRDRRPCPAPELPLLSPPRAPCVAAPYSAHAPVRPLRGPIANPAWIQPAARVRRALAPAAGLRIQGATDETDRPRWNDRARRPRAGRPRPGRRPPGPGARLGPGRPGPRGGRPIRACTARSTASRRSSAPSATRS